LCALVGLIKNFRSSVHGGTMKLVFIQLETSLMTFLRSIIQTNTAKTTHERDPLLAPFDARYNFERLIFGHTGSENYFL
jgi:hypothetical protein